MSGGEFDVEDDQRYRCRLWRRYGDSAEMVDQARDANGGTEAELTLTERVRLKELDRVVGDLRAETAFLKKASAYFARDQRL